VEKVWSAKVLGDCSILLKMNLDELCEKCISKFNKKKPINIRLTFDNGVYNICNIRHISANAFRCFDTDGSARILRINGSTFTIQDTDSRPLPGFRFTGEYRIDFWQTLD